MKSVHIFLCLNRWLHITGLRVTESWKAYFHSVPRTSQTSSDTEVAFEPAHRCRESAASDLLCICANNATLSRTCSVASTLLRRCCDVDDAHHYSLSPCYFLLFLFLFSLPFINVMWRLKTHSPQTAKMPLYGSVVIWHGKLPYV